MRPRRSPKIILDMAIEQGIDTIDQLRVDMRAIGLTESADALDQVFVKCLGDYVQYVGREMKKRPKRNGLGKNAK